MSQAGQAREALAQLTPAVEETLAELDAARVVERIWQRDPEVWGHGEREVTDRLGWLDSPVEMAAGVGEIAAFADQVAREGFSDAVLLGMGGSSLGAEVLHLCCGIRPGALRLHVLDSTVPAWVEGVRRYIEPERTLFLVSSKSGTTVEVTSLFDLFWADTAAAGEEPGRHFIAVTDPGSPLAEGDRPLRRTFLNPPDIGGRYSVLSYFGLVPAGLMGIDLAELLERGRRMAAECRRPAAENPGARLGAILGAAALAGRGKLTLLSSPRLASFGLWAEQLVAESTGKDGKGILPIAGEPLAAPDRYRDDRLFVALRLADDDNLALDAKVGALDEAGHPLVLLTLDDPLDLGAEFFRWQFATAVAGRLLGIQPFDQPDVEATKRLARDRLTAVAEGGELPAVDDGPGLAEALADGEPDYLAIMAYLPPSPGLEAAVADLRRHLLNEHRLATTFGYAPRLLHSTGQLHKGGPGGGLYLQLLDGDQGDGPAIPGRPYGLGTLAEAQAAGDALALRQRGRRCSRLRLVGDKGAAVGRLLAGLAG